MVNGLRGWMLPLVIQALHKCEQLIRTLAGYTHKEFFSIPFWRIDLKNQPDVQNKVEPTWEYF